VQQEEDGMDKESFDAMERRLAELETKVSQLDRRLTEAERMVRPENIRAAASQLLRDRG
jgi:hypothetical protein